VQGATMDAGRLNYSNILGSLASGGLSNMYLIPITIATAWD